MPYFTLKGANRPCELARVLLVDDDATSRLTLQALLEAGGYRVDSVTSAEEAISLMEAEEYELVLSDIHSKSPEESLEVLAHAQIMEYQPATALLTHKGELAAAGHSILVEPQNLPELFGAVATLIARRAAMRVEQDLAGSLQEQPC